MIALQTPRRALYAIYCRARATVSAFRLSLFRLVTLTVVTMTASAHIGSPDVWLEGQAGPYAVTVNVQVPGVVPGIAQVYVRVSGGGVSQVSAVGNRFDATAGSPPPEIARPVDGDPGLYHVPLWFMTAGSNSVTVYIQGTRGTGKLIIPTVIVAHERLVLSRPMAVGLGAMGILLFLGAVSVFGAAAREATLAPGVVANDTQRRRARVVMTVVALLFGVALVGGWRWWRVDDQRFMKTLYKPMTARATLQTNNGVRYLKFMITDSLWLLRHDAVWIDQHTASLTSYRHASALTPIVPDHGKLMHLFLISEPKMTAFVHLHPTTTDSVTFQAIVPSVPAGHYWVMADIVLESGDAETMMTSLDIPSNAVGVRIRDVAPTAPTKSDSDDSWLIGAATTGNTVIFPDSSRMQWTRGSERLVTGHPAPLTFAVTDRRGHPLTLEPYMGMAAHAVVLRVDGTVFVHLHPSGTASMGAQETFALRRPTDTVAGMVARRMQSDVGGMAMPMLMTGNIVRFPYAFPQPGRYYVWVQVKSGGDVLTGAFETVVGTSK